MYTMDDISRGKLMRFKKAELVTMVKIAMEERNRWEAEFHHLDKQYEDLLAYKNQLRDRYMRGIGQDLEDITDRIVYDTGGNTISLKLKD